MTSVAKKNHIQGKEGAGVVEEGRVDRRGLSDEWGGKGAVRWGPGGRKDHMHWAKELVTESKLQARIAINLPVHSFSNLTQIFIGHRHNPAACAGTAAGDKMVREARGSLIEFQSRPGQGGKCFP